jgi:hypothetical protein
MDMGTGARPLSRSLSLSLSLFVSLCLSLSLFVSRGLSVASLWWFGEEKGVRGKVGSVEGGNKGYVLPLDVGEFCR